MDDDHGDEEPRAGDLLEFKKDQQVEDRSGLKVGDFVEFKRDGRVQNGFSMVRVGESTYRDPKHPVSHIRRVMISFWGPALSVEAQARLEGGEPQTWCGIGMNEENPGFITIDAAIHPISSRALCESCCDAIIAALMKRNEGGIRGWVDVPIYHEPDKTKPELKLIKGDGDDDA